MRRNSPMLGEHLSSSALRYVQSSVGTERSRQSVVARLPIGDISTEGAATNDTEQADSPEEKLARLEAVLFLAREPLSTRKLAKMAQLDDGTQARTLLNELSGRYDHRDSALQVVEIAGGFQLLTRPQLADWIRRLHGGPEQLRLSAPALETLSVVAYRQPVIRAEIEAIRGVQCGEILRVLMERDLLRIVGRAGELGRPFLYGTTKNFLQVFGLRRLEQMPPIDQIGKIERNRAG